jgi:glutaredoxin 3
MIKIYGKPQCPFCDRAKALAEREGYNYEYLQLDVDFTREELFEKFPNARTFPQIISDDEYIGGYTEFEAWNNNTRRIDDYEDNPSDIERDYE